ncbi:MAG: response regulator [Litoreibacter sp.]|nr:response regulator [Litoreibacter sp.]
MADGVSRAAGDILDAVMPFLRRYGRALSGCRRTGDQLANRARQLARPKILDVSVRAIRIELFRALADIWEDPPMLSFSQVAARNRMRQVSRHSREVLLLRTIEEFVFEDIALILRIEPESVPALFETALLEMPYRPRKRVLLIEDDTLIAMDMANCVSEMGCEVTGVARTAAQAIEMGRDMAPELIIASTELAEGSSGRAAVSALQARHPKLDAVFVSPYPEHYLTGATSEPVLIIAKPCFDVQVRSVVSQSFILSGA